MRPAMAIASFTSAMVASRGRKPCRPGPSMRSLYRTLSFRYLSRRWLRTGLVALSISDATKARFSALYAFSKVPFVGGPPPILVGRELFDALPAGAARLKLQRGKASPAREYAVAGPVDASGDATALAGFVVGMDL